MFRLCRSLKHPSRVRSKPRSKNVDIYYEIDNYERAKFWFNKVVVDRDDSEAHYGLACLSFKQKKYKKSFDCFFVALKKGYTRSYYWLGLMYENGLGVDRNIKKAEKFYFDGAKCGYLISERAYLRIKLRNSSIFHKPTLIIKYLCLIFKVFKLAYHDVDDERLVDIHAVTFGNRND